MSGNREIDFEAVQQFIAEAGMTMLPSILLTTVQAASRAGCFKSDMAIVRFVTATLEKLAEAKTESRGS